MQPLIENANDLKQHDCESLDGIYRDKIKQHLSKVIINIMQPDGHVIRAKVKYDMTGKEAFESIEEWIGVKKYHLRLTCG